MHIPSVTYSHLAASETNDPPTFASVSNRSGPRSDMEQEPVSITYAEGSSIETDAERPIIDEDEIMQSVVAVQSHDEDDEMISLSSEPEPVCESMTDSDVEDDHEMTSLPVEQEHPPNRVVRR